MPIDPEELLDAYTAAIAADYEARITELRTRLLVLIEKGQRYEDLEFG